MLADVIVITETRYGGVYEGGPWAAFSVSDVDAIPEEAFSGDAFASGWWGSPTVPVGVGDSPDEALERLRFLVARDRQEEQTGYFAPGERVQVARCTPDEWYGKGIGIVRSVEFQRARPYSGGLRGQCIYTVDFDGATGIRVPEPYLRSGVADTTG